LSESSSAQKETLSKTVSNVQTALESEKEWNEKWIKSKTELEKKDKNGIGYAMSKLLSDANRSAAVGYKV